MHVELGADVSDVAFGGAVRYDQRLFDFLDAFILSEQYEHFLFALGQPEAMRYGLLGR